MAWRPMIYVIDDDGEVRDSIRILLELNDFQVRPYPSGEAFLRDERPDSDGCVVCDMAMTGLTGLDVVEQLRREGNMIPIILMAGDVRSRMLAAAERLDTAIIEKPFRPGELIARIKQSLGKN